MANIREAIEGHLEAREQTRAVTVTPGATILKSGVSQGGPMKLRAFIVHEKNGGYSAQIPALPGVFAAGRDMKELRACLREAVRLYLEVKQEKPPRVKRGQQVRELEVRI